MSVFSIILVMTAVVASSEVVNCTPSPILIIPGIQGSQLEVKDSKWYCYTFGNYVGLWINPLAIAYTACFKRQMTLAYNSNTNSYSNTNGVKIRAPGFGDTYSVEYLNIDFSLTPIPYFNNMVKYFTKRGYVRGRSIRAAPYDWRLAPEQLKVRGYYRGVKKLIETMYRENGNTKVTIVAHSMGGPISLFFLTSIPDITQEWKDKYIKAFIPLAGAWSGGSEIAYTEINGKDLLENIDFISTSSLTKPILRSFQSVVWLLPRGEEWNNKVIVKTPSRSYTVNDYKALFRDIGFPEGYTMYQGILNINKGWPAPNVPTHCFYGVGVPTELQMVYDSGFPDKEPIEIIRGDGDGDVNIESSRVCHRWSKSRYPFEYTEFKGVKHRQILSDNTVLRAIGNIVGVKN